MSKSLVELVEFANTQNKQLAERQTRRIYQIAEKTILQEYLYIFSVSLVNKNVFNIQKHSYYTYL